jgi:hypothetical protein
MTPRRPPNFGQRGLGAAPLTHAPLGLAGAVTVARRRLRSRGVVVGCISALALGLAAAGEYHSQRCKPQNPDDPNSIPGDCRSTSSSGGHSSAGHGYGFASSSGFGSSSSSAHASFGGFGHAGAGHGGGS